MSRILTARSAPEDPVTVLAFRDDGSFKPFKPLYNGKPHNISGLFQRSQDENLIAVDISASRENRPFAVIFHEYTHVLTTDTARPWPPWLDEGVAEFYSTFETQGTLATLGAPIADHVRRLREASTMMPLPALFAVDQRSPTYNEGLRQNIFYAESWAFVHYLMLANKASRQLQLRQFIDAVDKGAPLEEAFKDSFKVGYLELERELRSYIARQTYPVISYQLGERAALTRVDIRPMSPAEGQFHLGNLLLHTSRLDEAEKFFKQALSLDASAPEPYEGLGFLAMQRGQPDAAIEHFKQAVARNSRNHLAHYTYADALRRRAPIGQALAPDVARTVLDEARVAVSLRPGFLPAHHLLGYMYVVSELDLAQGLRAMTDARSAFPRDARLAVMLASLQVRGGDYAAARANLEAALSSGAGDEATKSDARRILAQIERAIGGR